MVLHGIAWLCIVLHGIALNCMVLLVLHGIAWYCMVLPGIAWYCISLHGPPPDSIYWKICNCLTYKWFTSVHTFDIWDKGNKESPITNDILCKQRIKDHLKLSHDDDNIQVVDVAIACPFHPPTFFTKIHIVPFSHFSFSIGWTII